MKDRMMKMDIKPGRCLQRVAKVGKTPTQCVKGHAHEDDHEDRYGQTFANHAIVPGADPLSPTAQALADASNAQDEAAREYREAKTPAERVEAEDRYEAAVALRWEAVNAHRKAREEAGDFLPRHEREAMKATHGTEGTKPEPTAKPKPFAFEYDATEGVLIAAALREKAKAERELAKELRISHDGIGAPQADNRAGLLSLAADRIHTPVHKALMRDFDKALTKAEEKPFHAKLKRDIGLEW